MQSVWKGTHISSLFDIYVYMCLHLISGSKNINSTACVLAVAFKIYDMDKDGYISNGELFQVLKMMVGNNLKDAQLQQIVDKTIIFADVDGDGKISFDEFCGVSDYVHPTGG